MLVLSGWQQPDNMVLEKRQANPDKTGTFCCRARAQCGSADRIIGIVVRLLVCMVELRQVLLLLRGLCCTVWVLVWLAGLSFSRVGIRPCTVTTCAVECAGMSCAYWSGTECMQQLHPACCIMAVVPDSLQMPRH